MGTVVADEGVVGAFDVTTVVGDSGIEGVVVLMGVVWEESVSVEVGVSVDVTNGLQQCSVVVVGGVVTMDVLIASVVISSVMVGSFAQVTLVATE